MTFYHVNGLITKIVHIPLFVFVRGNRKHHFCCCVCTWEQNNQYAWLALHSFMVMVTKLLPAEYPAVMRASTVLFIYYFFIFHKVMHTVLFLFHVWGISKGFTDQQHKSGTSCVWFRHTVLDYRNKITTPQHLHKPVTKKHLLSVWSLWILKDGLSNT